MWQTNLKILGIVIGTLGLYTLVASSIPQVASEVPEELSFGGDVSPEQLAAAGEELYNGAGGCTACHGLGTRAPNLVTDHAGEGTIGARCGTRVTGEDCKVYLHKALVEPAGYVVPGFDPMVFSARTLSEAQIWSLVAYLESQGGTVTVTGADIPAEAAPAGGAPAGGGAAASTSMDPKQLLTDNMCLGCHMLDGVGPPLGPSFDGIGSKRTADQIRSGIVDPGANAPPGYEAMLGVMPTTFGQSLNAAQLEAVVSYLAARK